MTDASRIRIEKTADGSHTLFVPELDEHYHSVNGAVQESLHVFIETGLKHVTRKNISVLEVGFGTGLNAILTWQEALRQQLHVHYIGLELYPLSPDFVSELNYSQMLKIDSDILDKLHKAPWGIEFELSDDFYLEKRQVDFLLMDSLGKDDMFDLIYYDAFAPDKQTEMWSQDIFDNLYSYTAENGILVTYCAKGAVRRMLQQSGYKVERLPGPPGKREMLRAIK